MGALHQQFAKGDLAIGRRGAPRVRVVVCTSTLANIAAVTAAVHKSPACTRLMAVASPGDLSTAPTQRPGQEPAHEHLTLAGGDEKLDV